MRTGKARLGRAQCARCLTGCCAAVPYCTSGRAYIFGARQETGPNASPRRETMDISGVAFLLRGAASGPQISPSAPSQGGAPRTGEPPKGRKLGILGPWMPWVKRWLGPFSPAAVAYPWKMQALTSGSFPDRSGQTIHLPKSCRGSTRCGRGVVMCMNAILCFIDGFHATRTVLAAFSPAGATSRTGGQPHARWCNLTHGGKKLNELTADL